MKSENASRLGEAIERLENGYSFGVLSELNRALVPSFEIDFPALWAETREVQALFNTMKPLDRDVREELWERFNRFRDAARNAQQSQRFRRDQLLDQNRGQLESAITDLEASHDLGWLDDLVVVRKNLGGFWSDARNIGKLFKEVKPLRRQDREYLWDWFQRLCERAHNLQGQLNEERERRHAEWRERMLNKIERLRELIQKNEGVVERLDEQIDRCEEMRSNARSPDFAYEVGGWIQEKEQKKDDILRTNRELWDKIAEIEAKLG
jgi:hypothetical protein